MKCKECVHYKLCRDLFCQVDTLTDDDKKCDYYEPPRPHGEWTEDLASYGYVDLECSVCGCLCECVECGKQYNFCPNCGADMKEGEEK